MLEGQKSLLVFSPVVYLIAVIVPGAGARVRDEVVGWLFAVLKAKGAGCLERFDLRVADPAEGAGIADFALRPWAGT